MSELVASRRVPTPKLTAQLSRVLMSERDFAEAEQYLNAYGRRRAEVVRRALLIAAVIAYARPFTNNERNGTQFATPFLAGNLATILPAEQRLLHEQLIALRHEALAHSQYSRKPFARVRAITCGGFYAEGAAFDILKEGIDVELFKALCATAIEFCVERMILLNKKIQSVDGV